MFRKMILDSTENHEIKDTNVMQEI